MKKLIIILLLIPILCNAQIARDKYYHAGAGVVGATLVCIPVYKLSKDPGLSFRAGWMAVTAAAVIKEGIDVNTGGEFSLVDAGVTIGTGLLMSWTYKKIFQRRERKKAIYLSSDYDVLPLTKAIKRN